MKDSSHLVEQLGESRERFLAFVTARVSSPEAAEDILQTSLVKAVENFERLKDQTSLVPWFYAILRNAITDSYRRGAGVREVELTPEIDIEAEPEVHHSLCRCFEVLLPGLKPEYAEVIESLDLRQEAPSSAAERLGVTPNNLKVRHHRARQALRRRLEETCRVCAAHHCLDCTCTTAPMPQPFAGKV